MTQNPRDKHNRERGNGQCSQPLGFPRHSDKDNNRQLRSVLELFQRRAGALVYYAWSGSKQPLAKGYNKRRTTEKQLRRWAKTSDTVAATIPKTHGLLVIDVDDGKVIDVLTLLSDHGIKCLIAESGSRGYHVYVRCPEFDWMPAKFNFKSCSGDLLWNKNVLMYRDTPSKLVAFLQHESRLITSDIIKQLTGHIERQESSYLSADFVLWQGVFHEILKGRGYSHHGRRAAVDESMVYANIKEIEGQAVADGYERIAWAESVASMLPFVSEGLMNTMESMWAFAGEGGLCRASQFSLAARYGLAQQRVSEWQIRAADTGWIERVGNGRSRNGRAVPVYRLLLPEAGVLPVCPVSTAVSRER